MTSESQKAGFYGFFDENRQNFKFSPGICYFNGVFGYFRKEMTIIIYTGSFKYIAAMIWS